MKNILKIIMCILFWISSYCSYAQIAITEVLYNTAFDESPARINETTFRIYFSFSGKAHHLGEFIELYNYTTEDICLNGWSVFDNTGNFVFPEDLVIKSESFLIIAYRDLRSKADIGNYFPIFYPNVRNQESQIAYQDQVMLNNIKEEITLYTDNLIDVKFPVHVEIASVSWDNTKENRRTNGFGDTNYKNLNNRNFYTNSLQLQPGNVYIEKPATPLTATYVPKTQHLLDIPYVQEILRKYTGKTDWSHQVEDILLQKCDLTIPIVQQFPKGNFDKEELCFEFDDAGNYLRTITCSDTSSRSLMDQNSLNPNRNTLDLKELSLEEIKHFISVYPNPTEGVVHVRLKEEIFGKIQGFDVFSPNGAIIISKIITATDDEVLFDITPYPTGIYTLRFKLNTGDFFSVNVVKK